MNPGNRLVDLLLRQVAQHDRHLEAAEREERELPSHVTRAGESHPRDATRLGVGNADAALRTALDEEERVNGSLCLRAGEKLRERVLLCRIPVRE